VTEISVRYVGGPTAVLEIGPWRLITDPTFDPAGRRYFFGWGTMSRKLQSPAVPFTELLPLDAVLLSHDHHGDNLDPTGRTLLPQMGTIVTTAAGAQRLGGATRGLAPGERTVLEAPGKPTLTITATPCRHGPPGSHPIVGDVVGFDISWEGQEHGTLWLSGDTVLYPGLRTAAASLHVSVALLNLGGVTFPWLSGPLRYTLNASEAIQLCQILSPQAVVPLHFEGWRHFTQPATAARTELSASPIGDRVRWPSPGETLTLNV
jgi:L-ascorbate metabolism protein UlaG (beta-lactamase superfamily)